MNCVALSGLKLGSTDLEFQISQALTWAILMTVGNLHLALRYSSHIIVCIIAGPERPEIREHKQNRLDVWGFTDSGDILIM